MVKLGAYRIYLAPCLSWKGKEYPKGAHGACEGRVIYIDPRSRANLIRTIVHELLHARHPNWSESRVQRETRKLIRKMSWKEQAGLLQAVMERAKIYQGKEDA